MNLEDLTFGQRVERMLKPLGLPVYACMMAWHYYKHGSLDLLAFVINAIGLITSILLECAMEHLFFIKPKGSVKRQKTP